MKCLNKLRAATIALTASAVTLMPMAASATDASSRLAGGQVTYLGKLAEIAILLLNSGLFLVSLFILGAGGWFFIKDYVLAKSDHEKAFTPGKLIAAMVVASLLGYSSGAYLLGQDLTVGEGTGSSTITQSDFDRQSE